MYRQRYIISVIWHLTVSLEPDIFKNKKKGQVKSTDHIVRHWTKKYVTGNHFRHINILWLTLNKQAKRIQPRKYLDDGDVITRSFLSTYEKTMCLMVSNDLRLWTPISEKLQLHYQSLSYRIKHNNIMTFQAVILSQRNTSPIQPTLTNCI